MDRWNDVLDWGPDPPMRWGNVLSLVQNQIVATALKYRQKTIMDKLVMSQEVEYMKIGLFHVDYVGS